MSQFSRVRSLSHANHKPDLPHRDGVADITAVAGSAIPPLHWWRRLPAPAFTTVHLAVIERAIKGFGFLGEPRWPAAAEGDPVAAVGVALRACKRHRKPNPGFDLVMSALLRCAIEGNNTGALVLGFLLDRMATDGAGYALLAASWRTKSVVSHAEYVAKDA